VETPTQRTCPTKGIEVSTSRTPRTREGGRTSWLSTIFWGDGAIHLGQDLAKSRARLIGRVQGGKWGPKRGVKPGLDRHVSSPSQPPQRGHFGKGSTLTRSKGRKKHPSWQRCGPWEKTSTGPPRNAQGKNEFELSPAGGVRDQPKLSMKGKKSRK